jgi:hypothetical protein
MTPVTELAGGTAAVEAAQKLAAVAGPEARLGDRRIFSDQTFHFETLKAPGYTRGAEVGEALETVGLITKGMSRVSTLHGRRPQTARLRWQLPLYRVFIIRTALVYCPNIQDISIFRRDDLKGGTRYNLNRISGTKQGEH